MVEDGPLETQSTLLVMNYSTYCSRKVGGSVAGVVSRLSFSEHDFSYADGPVISRRKIRATDKDVSNESGMNEEESTRKSTVFG